jgi:hypothetical protein
MSLTFQNLADKLAPGAVEFVGNNQLKVNFSQLVSSSEPLTFESSCVEGIVKLLQGLAALTDQINQERANQNPPLAPIEFVSQQIAGTPQQPKFQFIVEVAIDTQVFSSSLIDPTV